MALNIGQLSLTPGGSAPPAVTLPDFPDFKPTAEVPWITQGQRDLLRNLHDGMPLRFVSMMIEKRARDALLPGNPDPGMAPSIACRILNDVEGLDVLLHSIPREHIRAMVMGTLGWRISLNTGTQALPLSPYKRNGPGTHIAYMGIQGRHDRGLSGNEYKVLADKIESYLEAHAAGKVPVAQRTPQ
ncbi:hypothetical protein F4808DRAFT_471818 [Astrocystis sublimbata]|nr:hypothetical protein F4808DRAFT_471818 [Astrocystis sublimbata]